MESVRFQFPVAKSITNTEYIKHDSLTILNFITTFAYFDNRYIYIYKTDLQGTRLSLSQLKGN